MPATAADRVARDANSSPGEKPCTHSNTTAHQSPKDAVALAEESEGRYLAGGQSLVQAMKLRLSSPSDLIDLSS